MTNVINIETRLSANDKSRSDRIGKIASLLRDLARVPLEDRPVMAANLGKLALRISPNNALDGARRMFGTAKDSKWPKRKRLLRLPDEPAADPRDHGSYEGSGAAYLRLAEAAGSLLAAGSDEAAVGRSKRDALREMVLGTSLLPTFALSTAADRNIADLLHRLSERVAESVLRDTRLAELWEVLETTPLSVGPRIDSDLDASNPDPIEHDAKIPAELAELFWWKEDGVFSTAKPALGSQDSMWNDSLLAWAEPELPIGVIERRIATRLFVLPPELAAQIEPVWYFDAPEPVVDWFKEIGFDGDVMPEVEWSESTGYGWKDVEISVLHDVCIRLERGPARFGQLKLQLESRSGGYPTLIPSTEVPTDQVLARGADDEVAVHTYIGGSIFTALFCPIWSELGEKQGSLVGLFDHWGDYRIEPPIGEISNGWVEDGLMGAILLGDKAVFYPSIEAPAATVPCRDGSVAAALLRNIERAGTSFDQHLRDRARIIADNALRYHEALLAKYEAAIERIGSS